MTRDDSGRGVPADRTREERPVSVTETSGVETSPPVEQAQQIPVFAEPNAPSPEPSPPEEPKPAPLEDPELVEGPPLPPPAPPAPPIVQEPAVTPPEPTPPRAESAASVPTPPVIPAPPPIVRQSSGAHMRARAQEKKRARLEKIVALALKRRAITNDAVLLGRVRAGATRSIAMPKGSARPYLSIVVRCCILKSSRPLFETRIFRKPNSRTCSSGLLARYSAESL